MKLRIYSDTHEGASHSLEMYDQMMKEEDTSNVYLLGDIVDMVNCKKKDVPEWIYKIKQLEIKYGLHYVSGNHSAKYKVSPMVTVRNDILFTHGHLIFWTPAKLKEWQEKDGGKGKISRAFYSLYKVGIMGANRNLGKSYTPSLEALEKAYILARSYDCKTIVCGHVHGSSITEHKGIKLITVGRGITELDL